MTELEYIIYEAEANGEISINTRDEMLSVITEKKTVGQYRKEKFLKKHNYDPKTKTIEINGERIPFNDLKGTTKYNGKVIAKYCYKDNPEKGTKIGINMNNAAFNMKHPKSHEFSAQHERGHIFSRNHNKEMETRDWDDDDAYATDNLENKIGKQISKNGIKRKHGKQVDEYRADYYATQHMKDGFKTHKNAFKDILKRIDRQKDYDEDKTNRDDVKQEFDFRHKMLSYINKQKEAEYLRK